MTDSIWCDVAFSHKEVPLRIIDAGRARGAGPEQIISIVIDVLRATTTIVSALGNGCRAIYPCPSPEAGRQKGAALRAEKGQSAVILGGEQDGHPIEGFDGGNSPLEYTSERIENRILVMSTSNGTKTLTAAAECGWVAIATLANLSAAARQTANLAKEDPSRTILIACSGRETGYCEDDVLVAGLFLHELDALLGKGNIENSDTARASRRVAEGAGTDLPKILLECFWGRHLTELGMKEDIIFCGKRDWTDVVPQMRDGVITPT
jgi:2-phosphosulfolactate phosphatase